jgi:WD40 repeat protein
MPSIAGGYQPSWTFLLPHESSDDALLCSLALSANGTTLASGHSDHTIRIWDVASGDEVRTLLQGHSDSVWGLAFSADGRRIFSGSSDETVHLWDAVHGAEICAPLHGHGVTILSVGFYPDESRIITGCADRTIHVYDAASHREVLTPLRGHDGPVESVAVSPDGLQIVSGSRDKTVRLWNAITGTELLPPLQGHRDWVLTAVFASNGTCIISGSEDRTLRIWDSSTGAIIDVIRLRLPHKRAITKIALSCDGTRAVYGLTDGNIYVFDMISRKSDMLTLHGRHQGRFHIVHAVVLSPYVSPLVSAPHRQSRLATLHERTIRTIAFSSDGTRIATGSDDHNVGIWDAVTGQSAQKLLRGHKEEVVSLMFSPDGTRVISGSFDFTCRVWDVFSGTEVFEQLLGHTGVVWAVAFSPDGSRMASGSTDTTVRVWDAKTGIQSLPPLEGAVGSIRALAFSHDGGRIAVCSWEGNICIWGAATGVKVLRLVINGIAKEPAGPFRWSVEFSLDGLRIISNVRDNYCSWDTTTGNQLLDNAEYPFGELCNANHPIVITSGRWIIDLRTQRVLSRVPDIVEVQCCTGSKSSMALATVNGLVVMHFPHLMLAH